jgi:hypothetical protein
VPTAISRRFPDRVNHDRPAIQEHRVSEPGSGVGAAATRQQAWAISGPFGTVKGGHLRYVTASFAA